MPRSDPIGYSDEGHTHGQNSRRTGQDVAPICGVPWCTWRRRPPRDMGKAGPTLDAADQRDTQENSGFDVKDGLASLVGMGSSVSSYRVTGGWRFRV